MASCWVSVEPPSTMWPAREVDDRGAREADRVDAEIPVEAPVLDGDHRLRQEGRHLVERQRLAGGIAVVGDERAVGGEDAHVGGARRHRPVGHRRQLGGVIGDHRADAADADDRRHRRPVERPCAEGSAEEADQRPVGAVLLAAGGRPCRRLRAGLLRPLPALPVFRAATGGRCPRTRITRVIRCGRARTGPAPPPGLEREAKCGDLRGVNGYAKLDLKVCPQGAGWAGASDCPSGRRDACRQRASLTPSPLPPPRGIVRPMPQTDSSPPAARPRRPRLPGRWLVLRLSRLFPVDQPGRQVQLPLRRAADRRAPPVLHQALPVRARGRRRHHADPSRHRLRQVRGDLPQGDLPRLQGHPPRAARRPRAAVPADARGGARLRPGAGRDGRLRGRRHHRHLRQGGEGGRRRGAHHLLRQGPDAARRRHGALLRFRIRHRAAGPATGRSGASTARASSTISACRRRRSSTSRRWSATPPTTCPASPASASRPPRR